MAKQLPLFFSHGRLGRLTVPTRRPSTPCWNGPSQSKYLITTRHHVLDGRCDSMVEEKDRHRMERTMEQDRLPDQIDLVRKVTWGGMAVNIILAGMKFLVGFLG